jgi:chromate transport protein ChrA
LDGLALASVIPAPLVVFLAFVGFYGNGIGGSLLAAFGVFLPAFSFTLIGHNLFEKLIDWKPAHAFLDGVTASLAGMVATSALDIIAGVVKGEPLQVLIIGGSFAILMGYPCPSTSTVLVLGAAIAGQYVSRAFVLFFHRLPSMLPSLTWWFFVSFIIGTCTSRKHRPVSILGSFKTPREGHFFYIDVLLKFVFIVKSFHTWFV